MQTAVNMHGTQPPPPPASFAKLHFRSEPLLGNTMGARSDDQPLKRWSRLVVYFVGRVATAPCPLQTVSFANLVSVTALCLIQPCVLYRSMLLTEPISLQLCVGFRPAAMAHF